MTHRDGRMIVGRLGTQPARRALASLALLVGTLSGVITSTATPAGAVADGVNLICSGTSNDSAALFPDTSTGGFDSQFLVGFLIGQIGLPGPDEPQIYPGPQLGFAATAQLDHNLPNAMLTSDAPVAVRVNGSVQLSDGFLTSMRHLGITIPFGLKASNHVGVSGPGVTGDSTEQSVGPVTQDPNASPTPISVDITVTATPSPQGGPAQLDYDVDLEMALNQRSSNPGQLDLATLSMSCETAGEPQTTSFPSGPDPEWDGAEVPIAAPQPLADGFVARPGGIRARTDRLLSTTPTARLDVLANDEALGSGRSIDPNSLSVSSTDELVDIETNGDQLTFTAGPISNAGAPYPDGSQSPDQMERERFPMLAGLQFEPFVRAQATYRVCDDGDPAACADGLAEVIMPLALGDPCDDPNLQIDCGPSVPEPGDTCIDDMGACGTPECDEAKELGSDACSFADRLSAQASSAQDPSPDSNGEPADGNTNAPNRNAPAGNAPAGNAPRNAAQPSPGVPLRPTFTG